MEKELVLASTSKYRQELLQKLHLPFKSMKPLFDEEQEKGLRLSPLKMAEHLAFKKAESLATPNQVTIGGDQLVSFEGLILGKPHTAENAVKQLLSMQGKTHELVTAICIFDGLNPVSFTNITEMTMKNLNKSQLERYVQIDQPLDCAGAYKIEKMGITLFDKIKTEDFTAIQGIPLLELAKQLKKIGYSIP